MDILEIRDNYVRFDDETITRIAQQEAHLLQPEALEILKQEILKRDLSKRLIEDIDHNAKATETKIHKAISGKGTFYMSKGLMNYMAFFLTIGAGLMAFKTFRGMAILSLPLLFIGFQKLVKYNAALIRFDKEQITIALHSGYRFIFFIRFFTNTLQKLTVRYDDIERIYRGTNFLDSTTFYIRVRNGKKGPFEKRTMLHAMDKKNDLELLKRLLKEKNVVVEF